jgi:hypothetical protein
MQETALRTVTASGHATPEDASDAKRKRRHRRTAQGTNFQSCALHAAAQSIVILRRQQPLQK